MNARVITGATLAVATAVSLSACSSSDSSSSAASPSAAPTTAASSAPTSSTSPSSAPAATSGTASPTSTSGRYTLADVAKHSSDEDCWAAIKAPGASTTGVYDLTTWISDHPGGPERIKPLCGTDATKAFTNQHGEDGAQGTPEKRLATFKVGELAS